MARSPQFAGVVLAAGASSRMGRDKALLPWRGGTFLSHAIHSLASVSDFVLVIAGANHDRIAPVVYERGAFLIQNPDPSRGQFSSLKVGLNEVLNRGRDAAIITLVDRPAASHETAAYLKQEFLAKISSTEEPAAATWAVIPEFEGRHGHPYIAGRELIEAFLRAPANANARDIEHAHQAHLRYRPVADPFVVANVDTPEQYDQLA